MRCIRGSLKHCCRFRKALPSSALTAETKAMVSERDTDTVMAWLEQALGPQQDRPARKKALAEQCGVKVQAVDGWVRTGRITKRNLELAAQFLGSAPAFASAALLAKEGAAAYSTPSWPFKLVTRAEIAALSTKRVDRLERLMRERLDEWAEDDTTAKRRAAA